MLKYFLNGVAKGRISRILLCIIVFEFFLPLRSLALTSGPSQPEMQSFEPVGTTDLVDAFSGDFNYNIPLMDVEGYPVNISYHSGITMDQEASWVGLGWNINPGCITRNVRGIPDDFNGDIIEKTVSVNPEKTKKINQLIGAEFTGVPLGGINASLGMNFSNYTGISAELGFGLSFEKDFGAISAGINMGVSASTDNGADFNYNATLKASKEVTKGMTRMFCGTFGQQFNSRQGLMNSTFGAQFLVNDRGVIMKTLSSAISGLSNFSYVPISHSNYVPTITNAAFTNSVFFQIKGGVETLGTYLYGGVGVGYDQTDVLKNGNRNAYGYWYLSNSNVDDLVDFTRDRDGRFNREMKLLPPASMTYDVFNVTGQGTAGNFRAFRTDLGSVYDPYTTSENNQFSSRMEAGSIDLFEVGGDLTTSSTISSSGPWREKSFLKLYNRSKKGKLYEPCYFKQAGELTLGQLGANPLYSQKIKDKALIGTNDFDNAILPSNPDLYNRNPRANLLYFFNNAEASNPNISLLPSIPNYKVLSSLDKNYIPRVGVSNDYSYRKPHHISEVVQILPDGRRYIYGIPAMNVEQTEYVASVDATDKYLSNIDGKFMATTLDFPKQANSNGGELGQKFHLKTKTPAHAHSYLLTAVLSSDYSDLTGDGITDDDLGDFTKFNYTLKDTSYKWRTPYKPLSGRLDIGVRSDCHDDKATVIVGRKEIWMLHSIESRNFIAEFIISPRVDGKGSDDPLIVGSANNLSYKLDKIVLYNKKDRYVAGGTNANAFPIKTIEFSYDYSLCKGIPNHAGGNNATGKLTLKAISIKHGKSDIGMLSPYRFSYGEMISGYVHNPNYEETDKDVWGNYKATNGNQGLVQMSNFEFPYVNQNSDDLDKNAHAWNLTKVILPSGGSIKIEYESDDYAYVQDKRSMEMFKVQGVGYSPDFIVSPDNIPNDQLYQSHTNPALYLYFKLKDDPLFPGISQEDIINSYFQGIKSIQYNFEVRINNSGETTPSCDIPLQDNIKGYADIATNSSGQLDVGVCPTATNYGYIRIAPKYADKTGSLIGSFSKNNTLILNPITVSAIHYAQYYNNKALNPASEILSPSIPAILKALLNATKEYANYVRNPLISLLNRNLCKKFNIDRSYIRLQSQGFKKGGGHRVHRLIYSDEWPQMVLGTTVSTYGSEYEYTTMDEYGHSISSGVASYEPLLGGDENPFRNRSYLDVIGKKRVFPMTEPMELVVEEPIGESFYPSPSVGYSIVRVKSIHKDVGKSSQMIQVKEFYTAKEFPVHVNATDLQVIEDKYPKKVSLRRVKKDIFRAAQSYLIELNDMHGKPKAVRTLVSKSGIETEVTHTYYNYFAEFTHSDKKQLTLKNDQIPCAIASNGQIKVENRELGVEVDFTFDSREKIDKSRNVGISPNLNAFTILGVPLPPLPMIFPLIPRGTDKVFSSLVGTKVIQSYGVIKSIETFDKGSTVIVSNEVFDPMTGQVLVTAVNTEHNDKEYSMNIPAYWAYNEMGPSYENILYEENLHGQVSIVNDTAYIYTDKPERFNVGDELVMNIKNSCEWQDISSNPENYKLWVIDKTNSNNGMLTPNLPKYIKEECFPSTSICGSNNLPSTVSTSAEPLRYNILHKCRTTPTHVPSLNGHLFCISNKYLNEFFQVMALGGHLGSPNHILNAEQVPIERIEVSYLNRNYTHSFTHSGQTYTITGGHGKHSSCLGNSGVSINEDDGFQIEGYKNPDFTGNVATLFGGSTSNPVYPNYESILASIDFIRVDYKMHYQCAVYPVYSNKVETTFQKGNGIQNVIDEIYDGLNTSANVNNQTYSNDVQTWMQNNTAVTTTPELEWVKYSVYIPCPPDIGLATTYLNTLNTPQTQYHYGVGAVNWPGSELPNPKSYFHRFRTERIGAVKVKRNDCLSHNTKTALVALPLKRGATSTTGLQRNWPNNDTVITADIKVIRSGKRNHLTEKIQELTTLKRPINVITSGSTSNQYLSFNYNSVISIQGTEYTDVAQLPDELNNPTVIYNNIIVTGGRGTYRPLRIYLYHNERVYDVNLDKNKGLAKGIPSISGNVPSLWQLIPQFSEYRYFTLKPTTNPNAIYWFAKSTVTKYDSWGNDLEVKDASGNIHANLFGYGHRLPIAIVSNSNSDNSLFENFEDYAPHFNQFIQNTSTPSYNFPYYNNPIKKKYFENPTLATIENIHHSGIHSFTPTSNSSGNDLSIDIPFVTTPMTSLYGKPVILPFHMRQQHYVFNFWQKVSNNSQIPSTGAIKVKLGSTTCSAIPKTPIIDNWVMYEGKIDATSYTGTQVELLFKELVTVDDLRIIPNTSNMKAYVYHPVNRRLLAVLDENHLSTYFDYTPEGKLVRIKKETEKGIITLKESRESYRRIIEPLVLIDPSAWYPGPTPGTYTMPGSSIPHPVYTTQWQNNSQ